MIRPLRLSVTVCDRLDDSKHCALCKYNLDCYCREDTDDIMNVKLSPVMTSQPRQVQGI